MYCSGNGYLYYNRTNKKAGCKAPPGSTVEVLLDMDKGTLRFIVDGKDQGVAITDKDLTEGEYFITLALGLKGDAVNLTPVLQAPFLQAQATESAAVVKELRDEISELKLTNTTQGDKIADLNKELSTYKELK